MFTARAGSPHSYVLPVICFPRRTRDKNICPALEYAGLASVEDSAATFSKPASDGGTRRNKKMPIKP